jgi:DNA-binding Lrp family transcriptional regulator
LTLNDNIDREILQSLSGGIYSYEDLARKCGVTRNTVYRRIALMEKKGLITKTTRAVLNYEKLEVIPICIAINISHSDVDKAVSVLEPYTNINLLWRTFGSHDITLVLFCYKGDEGKKIDHIKDLLKPFCVHNIEFSIGYIWEKTNFAIP